MRVSPYRCRISSFSQFLIESSGKHTGIAGPHRASLLVQEFRELKYEEREALKARGEARNYSNHKPTKLQKERVQREGLKRRKPNLYARFVAVNYPLAHGAAGSQKIAWIAKVWKSLTPRERQRIVDQAK